MRSVDDHVLPEGRGRAARRQLRVILEAMTGSPAPEAHELVEFVQRSYNQVFGRRSS